MSQKIQVYRILKVVKNCQSCQKFSKLSEIIPKKWGEIHFFSENPFILFQEILSSGQLKIVKKDSESQFN